MDDNEPHPQPDFTIHSGSTLALIIGLSVTAGLFLLPIIAYCLCRGCWQNANRPIMTLAPAPASVASRRGRTTMLGWPQNIRGTTEDTFIQPRTMQANSTYPTQQGQHQQPQYRASDITASGRPNAPPPSYLDATNYPATNELPPPYPGLPTTAYQTVTYSPRNS